MKNFLRFGFVGSFLLSSALGGCAQNTLATASVAATASMGASATPRGWRAVPIVTAELKARGFSGGEGAQWVRALAVDAQSGNFMLWGTDVGGLFRSRDGGKNWEPCNVGYSPRGTAGLAIDPRNNQRVLSIGANSVSSDYHGVWLSENGASSWRQTFKANISGTGDTREQIAFDPSSYDATLKMTKTVYWSRIRDDQPMWGNADKHPALYKSGDGGRTWTELENSADLGGGIVKVHPSGAAVYVGNERGLQVSRDGGKTWQTTFSQNVTGLDVSRAASNNVWLTTEKGVWISRDSGAAWTEIAGDRVLVQDKATLKQIKVAPSDANRLALWRQGENYQWPRFYSHDGGATWQESKVDGSLQVLPTNARNGLLAFHPRNPDILLSTGGDYPTLSRDGGKTFVWTGNGVNNIMAGKFNFNAQNPDLLLLSSQDYNGATTQDGGASWTYQNPTGNGWGGATYGAYAVSPQAMALGIGGWTGTRLLTTTQDGGKTWTKTELKYGGPEIGLGDPQNAQVAFVSNFRTQDGGKTWQAMTNCDGVFTADGNTLYGIKWNEATKSTNIVTSDDSGASFRVLETVSGGVDDIAAGGGRVFYTSNNALYQWQNGAARKIENLPNDQWGHPNVGSVAIDPQNPNAVYTAGSRNLFSSSAAAARSTDGGKTWQNLTVNTPLSGTRKDGGREAYWVRVHPKTREAWFTTGCYGVWKYVP